ncbi:hypothetical protein [Salinicola aestuarinus]|uniref:hypothetical protein n=1 Tax=Salinicola aestuarinus TaxID=1949082 RepID=UPI000DA17DB1|nr:hypothetical protein [Salinicola aestuarinus]
MKIRTLAAIAIAAALPAVAQANSAVNERLFALHSESLNVEQTAEYQALPTQYSVDTVRGGHSVATDEALGNVAHSTQQQTHIQSGNTELVGQGHSVAASQALENVDQAGTRGDVNFATL